MSITNFRKLNVARSEIIKWVKCGGVSIKSMTAILNADYIACDYQTVTAYVKEIRAELQEKEQ